MRENKQEEERFQREVQELRRLVWLDFCQKVIGEELMARVDEEKYFSIIRNKRWTLKELSIYLVEHCYEFVKEEN